MRGRSGLAIGVVVVTHGRVLEAPHSASATGSGENRLTKQANVQHLASTWHANLGQDLYAGTEPIPNEFLRAKLLLALHMYLN